MSKTMLSHIRAAGREVLSTVSLSSDEMGGNVQAKTLILALHGSASSREPGRVPATSALTGYRGPVTN